MKTTKKKNIQSKFKKRAKGKRNGNERGLKRVKNYMPMDKNSTMPSMRTI